MQFRKERTSVFIHPASKHTFFCRSVLLQPSLLQRGTAIQTRPSSAKTAGYHTLPTDELQACSYDSLVKSPQRQQHSSCLAQCQPTSSCQEL